MNSDKNYKWDKMKYEIMNIKVEVNMMDYTIISNKHNHNNSKDDN